MIRVTNPRTAGKLIVTYRNGRSFPRVLPKIAVNVVILQTYVIRTTSFVWLLSILTNKKTTSELKLYA